MAYRIAGDLSLDGTTVALEIDGTWTKLVSNSPGSNTTITLPNATATLAGIGLNNTWTGTNTFNANVSLGSSADLAINTNKFTVAASSGNTLVAGTLDATGATALASTLAGS